MEKFIIEKTYAFLAMEEDGEGVVAMLTPEGWMPLMGGDPRKIELLKPVVQEIANKTGKEIKLCCFSERTDIEIIKPIKKKDF